MFDSIYLSPHLDDVALSCGGQIHQLTRAGREVLIVTITAGEVRPVVLSSFARLQHAVWGFAPDRPVAEVAREVVQARRAEDLAAAQILGAEIRHWSWPDCIYRTHPLTGEPLYTSDAAIFGPLHPVENSLIAELAENFAALPPAGRVVAPLSIGNHVDHQLTRQAAEAQFGTDLWYYEDYPYAQRDPAQVNQLTATGRWQAELIELDDAAVAARLAAVEAYASQLEMLFSGREAMRRAVRDFIQDRGGERLWRQK